MAALATKPLTESTECDALVRSTSAGDEEGLSSDASHWSFESDRTCASHDIASISGIDDGLREELALLSSRGVRIGKGPAAPHYMLRWGGEVAHSGNCLFEAFAAALGDASASAVRERCVAQFLALHAAGLLPRGINQTIQNLYCPDLTTGWAVHFIQEHKLLLPAAVLPRAEAVVAAREAAGASYNEAAEEVFREAGAPVDSAAAWARYMALDGGASDRARVVALQYVDGGADADEGTTGGAARSPPGGQLLSVDIAAAGTGAFGDDLAIECLAAAYGRDVYVVQAHGEDAGTSAALFFLPHAPLGGAAATAPPLFLLMKGCGWTGAGADHFEPLIATRCGHPSEPPYITL